MFRRLSLFLAFCTLAMAACTASDSSDSAAGDSGASFWEQLRFAGNEVEGYSTIAEMSGAADAVVTARISAVEPGRVFQGDAAEDRVYYVRLVLELDQVISGQEASTVPMELLLPGVFDDQGFERAVAQLAESAPRTTMLAFLREKNDPDPGIYRPVNSVGLFASTERAALDTPLSEEPPAASGRYESELAGLQTLDELIAQTADGG